VDEHEGRHRFSRANLLIRQRAANDPNAICAKMSGAISQWSGVAVALQDSMSLSMRSLFY
jgi:hypothetical protein